MKRNPHIQALKAQYLFPQISHHKAQYLARNPSAELISLGIGDTTEPIPQFITKALFNEASALGTQEGYSGYCSDQGFMPLRDKISSQIYADNISKDEIFISDGAKCDIGRLQLLFGCDVSIAVQDPAYPVYIDGSLIHGVKSIVYMPCTAENDFFPNLDVLPRTDLIYFCSPNNPTGTVATKKQLQQLVTFAKQNHSIIIFDAAYANYIQDESLPKSIYEIAGAKEVAIEVGSFSKLAGFTGVRLGWTVVPNELKFDDGCSVKADWNRVMATIFNGASNISQHGGYAVLLPEGWTEVNRLTQFYLENSQILKGTFETLGFEVFGGVNAPYLWVRTKFKNSWEAFHHFLEHYQIVTTPGSGFGPSGEGFIRLTAFGKRLHVLEAARRLSCVGAET